MLVYVRGRKLHVDPARSIGKGAEADVFDIGGGKALKLFKTPDHPDLAGDVAAQEAARRRIGEHQEKLRAFPRHLPSRVVLPEECATDANGLILGYTMRLVDGAEVLLRYGDRGFRQDGGGDAVIALFRDLHGTVAGLHRAGVVIGDFNDLNVLARAEEAHLIDTDSFQFGSFLCTVYTERFVDPLLCDQAATRPILVRPHTSDSDWYAFAVMLMRSLLFVDPYGGVYRPKDPARRTVPAARPLRRITVFHAEVVYPRPALRWDVLPDALLQQLHLVFEKDQRGEFPARLLEGIQWTRCTACGIEHARPLCPSCTGAPPAAVREVTAVRGEVTATRVFRTPGHIVLAALQGGALRWLYAEGGAIRREDGTVVLEGDPGPRARFRICGKATLAGRDGTLATLAPGRPPTTRPVDGFGRLPAFDANERHVFWVRDGTLYRDGPLGPDRIGDVLAGQTLLWVGPRFGFGFYRAGELHVSFVFSAFGRGLNDGVRLPKLRGQLVDATCFFSEDRAWFLSAAEEGGRTVHRCAVVRPDGSVEAAAEAARGDGSWLSEMRGKCASGGFLLAATDDGIVRLEPRGGAIVLTREFPDTEPFVDSSCRLFPGLDGLYVVDRQEIRLLRIRS